MLPFATAVEMQARGRASEQLEKQAQQLQDQREEKRARSDPT